MNIKGFKKKSILILLSLLVIFGLTYFIKVSITNHKSSANIKANETATINTTVDQTSTNNTMTDQTSTLSTLAEQPQTTATTTDEASKDNTETKQTSTVTTTSNKNTATTTTPKQTTTTSTTKQATTSTKSKKGVASCYYANNDLSKITALNGSWFYNWSTNYSANSSKKDNLEYVPMIWGAKSVTTTNINALKQGKSSGKYTNLLGFNEPDLSSQANMTVQQCIDLWPQLISTGLRLGSPVPTTPDNGWLDNFIIEANKRGYKVDFIALHFYPDFTNPNSVNDIKTKITKVHNKYKKPIWITEIGTLDINAWGIKTKATPTQAAADTYIKNVISMLDSLSYVERYAWFTDKCIDDPVAKYSSLYNNSNNLTSIGKIYQSK